MKKEKIKKFVKAKKLEKEWTIKQVNVTKKSQRQIEKEKMKFVETFIISYHSKQLKESKNNIMIIEMNNQRHIKKIANNMKMEINDQKTRLVNPDLSDAKRKFTIHIEQFELK